MNSNDKLLTKPYCLSRVDFLRQFYAYAKDRKIKGSGKNLSDFKTILGNRGTKLFKTETWAAMQLQVQNDLAIAAGLAAIPVVIVPPIPNNENLPTDPPNIGDVPNTAVAIERWKIMERISEDFDTAKTQLKSKMQAMLPPEVFKSLERSKGVEGWAIVEPSDVFDYILSNEMGNITAAELQTVQDAIKNPWDKRKALRTNLEEMVEKNNLIGETFPHMKLNDQLMFQIAFHIAENPIYDLKDTINDFMMLPGQDITTSVFPEFMEYILEKYPKLSHDENKGHLAFSCEKRYKRYGMAATESTIEKDEEGLALAANAPKNPSAASINPPKWDPKEYAELLRLRKAQKAPPTPTNPTQHTQLGRICFLCGWNSDHNSRSCTTMQNAAPGTYTDRQMNLTRFSPTRNNHELDGKPINQNCAPGVHGWP